MFDVVTKNDAFVCTGTMRLARVGEVRISDPVCEVTLDLGVSGKSRFVETLRRDFERRLQALAEQKSKSFLVEIQKSATFLTGAMKKAQAAGKPPGLFVTQESKNVEGLWKNWCERVAPRLADDALAASLKAAKDADTKEVETKRKKATGKVSQMPKLEVAAGAASALAAVASGNVPAALAGVLKMYSAYLKDAENNSKALLSVARDQAALVEDAKNLYQAAVQLHGRLAEMDKARAAAERDVIELTRKDRLLRREVEKLQKAATGDVGKRVETLNRLLDKNAAEITRIDMVDVDTATIRGRLNDIRNDLKDIHAEAAVGFKSVRQSAGTAKTVVDVVREGLTVLAGIAKLVK